MPGIVFGLYSWLLSHYQMKWEQQREKQKWDRWEEYQKIASDMGQTTNIVKVQRRKTRPPRKKHRH